MSLSDWLKAKIHYKGKEIMPIQLGSKVKDTITGFTGIATGFLTFMYGCNRVQITPQELHEGKTIDPEWFDDQRVEVIAEQKPTVEPTSVSTSGGDEKNPVHNSRRP